jgi:hypothetical protein
MIFSRRPKKPVPGPRHVTSAGHTAAFSYRSLRSETIASTQRQSGSQATSVRPSTGGPRTFRHTIIGRVAIIIVVIAVGLYVLSLSTDVRVVALGTNTTLMHPLSTYERGAHDELNGSIGNHIKLLIDTASLRTGLAKQFPELQDISVGIPLFGHRPIVYLTPAQPAFALLTTINTSYIIDTNGRAIVAVDATHWLAMHLVPVKDLSGTVITVGQPTLSSGTVTFIRTIIQQLALKHLAISTFVLPVVADELDMYIDGGHYFVKFNLHNNDSALQQVGTLLAVKHSLEGRGVTPSEYIDVRIDGRAYYK